MKKLFAYSFFAASLLFGSNSVRADWDLWEIASTGVPGEFDIYTVDLETNTKTLRTTKQLNSGMTPGLVNVDGFNNLIIPSGEMVHKYNLDSNQWTDISGFSAGSVYLRNPLNELSNDVIKLKKGATELNIDSEGIAIGTDDLIKKSGNGTVQIGGDTDDIDIVSDGLNIDGTAVITKNTDGSVQIGGDTDDIDVVSDGLNIDGSAVITKNADGSIQIGADGNDIDITSEGLTVDGVSLITKKDSGEIHIGKNSLITKEEDGVQKLYAQDENDNAININVTNGSKLLIDGVEVQTGNSAQVTTNKNNISTNTSNISTNTSNISTNTSNISTNTSNISTNTSNISTNTSNISTNTSNIKNLGSGVAGSTALTAALTALPQTSKESKLSCGVGSSSYSSRYAVGFGCASKVNERVDINAGGSYVFGGSKSYGGGTLDSGVVKAGFVFKLGELNKPTQISMKEKKEFKKEIIHLQDQNKSLNAKISKFEQEKLELLARLERIEKIALGEGNSPDLAVYQLK